MKIRSTVTLLAIAWTAAALASGAHGDMGHVAKQEQRDWGIPGHAKSVQRTIVLSMGDNMRFTPDRVEVKQGETVKFVVKNSGQVLHEFVLGTKEELDEHAAMMLKSPKMAHDEASTAHVQPGKSGEVIWTFNRAGDFDFACLIPGHYQAGMAGKVKVVATP